MPERPQPVPESARSKDHERENLMTTRATVARHRAEVTKTNSLAVIAKAVGDNAGGVGRQAAVIAAASGLVLTSGIAANAAETNVQRESTSASALEVQSAAPATTSAASTIAISYEKPVVKVQGGEVVTTIKVKNLSYGSIAGLKLDEYWYDKAGNIVTGDSKRVMKPIMPNEIVTIELRTPKDPKMNRNTFQFSHANGNVKVATVPKFE